MEAVDNRKNLFIEITEGAKQSSIDHVLTNWGRPPPLQYHLINAPAINFQLATLPAHPHKSQTEFFPQRNREISKWPKRNGQRQRFRRLREELRALEEELCKNEGLHESELLAYKQRLLVDYLGRYVEQTGTECIEKAEFLKAIWNLLVRIFEGLCQRLVSEGKRKEGQFLREELATHSSYQAKLEEFQTKNAELKESDDKYQNIVRELMTNIAKLNAELKGQRSLFDRTASSLAELTHKYGQLRSEYLEILVNGYSETMSRERAEASLIDKELLLFTKQLTTGNHGIRAKKGRERRMRVVNNDIDVGLLLEELEAQDDYSFQIDTGERKEVTYANQRTQTVFVGYQGQSMGVQCDYVSRCEEGQLKNRSAQTNPPPKVTQRQAQDQTNPAELLHRPLQAARCFSFTQYPVRVEPRSSIKLVRNSSKQYVIDAIGARKQPHMEDAATCISFHTIQEEGLPAISINQANNDNPPQIERRQSKMIRISESRESKRLSKNYLLRVKTETNEPSSRNSRTGKRGSRDIRVSQFLVLENLRQTIIKNVSSFKKSQIASSVTLQIKLRRALLVDFQPSRPLGTAINSALETCQADKPQRERQFLENVRNLQLSSVNQGVREKISAWEGLHSRKGSSYLPAHKCLRGIGEVFKLAKRFIAIGCNSINLVNLTCEWLSAVEGKPVNIEHNPKKLVDFLRSCLNLYGEHYLIRNFVLLCGMEPPGKDDRLVKMSKISFDLLKQRVEGDRLNRTSDFKFQRQTRETENSSHPQASLLYSSEVVFYFDLLEALNCSDSKEDLSRFYTTYERFQQAIQRLSLHYRNSLPLLAEIRQAVRLSVEDWGSESQSKLNIFKCLQLIVERVLAYKGQIEVEFTKIFNHCGEAEFTENLVGLSGVSASQYTQTLLIAHQCYPKATPCDLATLFLIEGLKIDVTPFSVVEKDHKVTIIKRLIANREKQRGLSLSIIQSFEKRTMKKSDFHLLLRSIWTKENASTLQGILGDDLLCLYASSVPYGQSEAGVGFHRAIREAFRLW